MLVRAVVALTAVLLLTSSVRADLGGSQFVLVEPAGPIPEQAPIAVNFVFLVQNDSESTEAITRVSVLFPPGLAPQTETMWYDEIGPGWPVFDAVTLNPRWVEWVASCGAPCGIPIGESTHFGLLTVHSWLPDGWAELYWEVWGADGGELSGQVAVYTTPVECESWARVKAMYVE